MDPVTIFLIILITALIIGHLMLFFLGADRGNAASVAAAVKSQNARIFPPLSSQQEPMAVDVHSKNMLLERKLELAHMRLQRMEKELRAMQAAKSEKGELIDLRPASERKAQKRRNN